MTRQQLVALNFHFRWTVMLQAFAQGLRRGGPSHALSSSVAVAVRQGQVKRVAAATRVLNDLHLTPLVLRAAVQLGDVEDGEVLATINLEALQVLVAPSMHAFSSG